MRRLPRATTWWGIIEWVCLLLVTPLLLFATPTRAPLLLVIPALWGLMKVGERRLNLLRAFNAREGVGAEADTVPPKLLIPLQGGLTDGVAVTAEEVEAAKALYYQMSGWDKDGRPTRAKLEELALGWVADELRL